MPPRPAAGPVIWLHLGPQSDTEALAALAQRMAQDDREAFWVCTGGDPVLPPPLVAVPQPPDSPSSARAFLDHWRPDLVIWMQGGFLGSLLSEVDARDVPRLLVDADDRDLALLRSGWRDKMRRGPIDGFRHALALDEASAARLRRLGLPSARIEVTGPLNEGAVTLPGREPLRSEIAEALSGRPVWFVPAAPMTEFRILAEAHLAASRRSHRLLLVVEPAGGVPGPTASGALRQAGLRGGTRTGTGLPSEMHQAFVVDTEGELGTWYRLAPVTCMGGTFETGGGRSPYEPAALGSAVLHGPMTAPHDGAYRRLMRGRATRSVTDPRGLGAALGEILAPDRSAALAHAAWSTLSAGAPVTNRLMDLICEIFDEAGI
ncbi:3-deoxy-D-manno-octulosonic acid transferase [Histidinibacterium lentulum]|uniref:3-deoxy-D-manno-octulosonic acid transferase n=1 Tax=Histidinibacterium lentulum TaxID=2480588 RepID=A0A3N2R643_9RHOB|nr:glycosyltransferase N-terminal domain-containing protein [Histidinibacterium lentulum]ROU02950.1 3-deoxy-D-manno-octulosonic acid transferase [Histidinibacterium lentulum]